MVALNFPNSPSNGDVYQGYTYNSTKSVWEQNTVTPSLSGLFDVDVATKNTGDSLVYNGTKWVDQANSFANLTDTTMSTPVTGDSLVYNGTNWVNGPRSGNAIINGDFGIWQRGTSFNTNNSYTSDRFHANVSTSISGLSRTISRETFSTADIEAIGYGDAEYFLRDTITTIGGATGPRIQHRVEDVRTFSGQKVTASVWAKSSTHNSLLISLVHNFGSGGSTATQFAIEELSISSNWSRIFFTTDIPSVVGKTIGSGSYLELRIFNAQADNSVLDIWGVQVEAGPVATPFKLAGGGSKAAELALCQRYYWKSFNQSVTPAQNAGVTGALTIQSNASSTFSGSFNFPTAMRTNPTITTFNPLEANANFRDANNSATRTLNSATGSESGIVLIGLAGIVNGINRIHAVADAEL
jgi:hypothetical protein